MKGLCFFVILCGCATPADNSTAHRLYGEYQAACMAAEMDTEYTYDCVRAAYAFCREAYRVQRLVWVSRVNGRRDRAGNPTSIVEMRHDMSSNGCHPKL